MSKVFYGGQIKKELRGKEAVVIRKAHGEQEKFLYPMFSEEFTFLTGAGTSQHPTDRVYIGVSTDTGKKDITRFSA